MLTSSEFKRVESCLNCIFRTERSFCGLNTATLEGQTAEGIFVLCKGQVKLSLCAGDGKTFILKIAQTGEAFGLSAAISGKPYEFTAATVESCEISFAKRDAFLRLMEGDPEACFQITQQLGLSYYDACHEIRSLGLSQSAGEKLAKLLLEWSLRASESDESDLRVKLPITQDEIAQMIGCCRETVTRLFADLKRRRIAEYEASTLLIRDMAALKALAENRSGQLRLRCTSIIR
jgi:CRP/FNR family transcriptional regulator, cyclic AMP receptor protein